MRVKVIGCSTTWTQRSTSCYLIDNNILVDCGIGSIKRFQQSGVKFKEINTFFITHLHFDHIFDISGFLYSQSLTSNEYKSLETINIFGPKGIKKYILKLLKLMYLPPKKASIGNKIKIHEITDFSKPFNWGKYTITPYKLKHDSLQNIGYVFSNGKVNFGFSGDTTDVNLEAFIENCDYLLLDASGFKTTITHLGVDKFLEYKNKYPQKHFFAVHCNDEVYDNAKKLGLPLAKENDEWNF